jgi:hypothetical protein
MIDKNRARAVIREMFPNIPLPEQEKLLGQIQECLAKFGMLRTMTIGEVLEKLVERSIVVQKKERWTK